MKRKRFSVEQIVPFIASELQLRELIALMDRRCQTGVVDMQLAVPARKVLRTMRAYWPGLVLFLEHFWLDLDSNAPSAHSGLRWSGARISTASAASGRGSWPPR